MTTSGCPACPATEKRAVHPRLHDVPWDTLHASRRGFTMILRTPVCDSCLHIRQLCVATAHRRQTRTYVNRRRRRHFRSFLGFPKVARVTPVPFAICPVPGAHAGESAAAILALGVDESQNQHKREGEQPDSTASCHALGPRPALKWWWLFSIPHRWLHGRRGS
jgi:hypothetical protein